MITDREHVHSYDLDKDTELMKMIDSTEVSIEEVAEFVERSAPGADLVTVNDSVRSPASLLIEQYALLLDDKDLTANITSALGKFKSWLFKFSPELARL